VSHRSKPQSNVQSPSRNGSSTGGGERKKPDRSLLYRLLETPSPTGSECDVQDLLIEELGPLADVVEHDAMGNVFFGLNTGGGGAGSAESRERRRMSHQGEDGGHRPVVMLEAHADQVGFLVKHIDDNGYIYVEHLGGIDEVTLPGTRVVFVPRRRKDGLEPPPPFDHAEALVGVFSKKATHLQDESEKKNVPGKDSIWIDIGATGKEETRERVRVGDAATFELKGRVLEMENQRIVSPGLDDKAGLYAVAETFRRCARAAERGDLVAELWVVSSTQEEVGLRGATIAAERVEPDVALAVDVVNAADDPGNDKKTTIPCTLGAGPTISGGPNTNPVAAAMLRAAAERCGVEFQQLQSAELEGNDSKSMQVAGRGVATVSVGIPNRAMHTQVEVCHLRDIDDTVELLTEFVLSVDRETDFRPLRPRGLDKVGTQRKTSG